MNVIRQEIRTGLLVVFSLAILILVVLYLGAPGVFVPQKTYFIYVENAAGLRQGADVGLGGRKVGQVVQLYSPVPESERPNPKSETKIEIRVTKTAKIYRDVRVMLTQNGFLGEMFIDFASGVEASGMAEDKHAFMGEKPASLNDLAPKVMEKLDPIIKEATATLVSLRGTATNINRITAPEGDLPGAINQFRRVGANLELETGPNGQLHATLANFARLTADDGKISTTLDNIRNLTGPESSVAHAMRNAEKFTADLAKNRDLPLALQNSRRATEELNQALTELRFKFSAVGSNLEQASDTVKKQPWRLIWPSTKKYGDAEKSPEGTKPRAEPEGTSPRKKSAARR